MLYLISGGSGSGKSEYAESLVLSSGAKTRVYLATMQIWDEECRRRVARHRAMRREKGFVTVERPTDLAGVQVPADSVVLLEDLSNLAANECYGGCGFQRAEEAIWEGICSLCGQARDVVIVTNELFSDGIAYDPATRQYLALLAGLNCRIAAAADQVIEIVLKIPLFWKGEQP